MRKDRLKSSAPRSKTVGAAIQVELLEFRRLLSIAIPAGFHPPEALPTASSPPPITPATLTTYPLTDVPTLNSLPSAKDEIYLDFVGAAAFNWGGENVPATPSYDYNSSAPNTF